MGNTKSSSIQPTSLSDEEVRAITARAVELQLRPALDSAEKAELEQIKAILWALPAEDIPFLELPARPIRRRWKGPFHTKPTHVS
mmetsp:Transcript_20398/g.51685  ORF Transcript_20398/g.51685 Transcript_20398/m.51685 type:complete len:85 (+) Transcript_20398:178-432(+)